MRLFSLILAVLALATPAHAQYGHNFGNRFNDFRVVVPFRQNTIIAVPVQTYYSPPVAVIQSAPVVVQSTYAAPVQLAAPAPVVVQQQPVVAQQTQTYATPPVVLAIPAPTQFYGASQTLFAPLTHYGTFGAVGQFGTVSNREIERELERERNRGRRGVSINLFGGRR